MYAFHASRSLFTLVSLAILHLRFWSVWNLSRGRPPHARFGGVVGVGHFLGGIVFLKKSFLQMVNVKKENGIKTTKRKKNKGKMYTYKKPQPKKDIALELLPKYTSKGVRNPVDSNSTTVLSRRPYTWRRVETRLDMELFFRFTCGGIFNIFCWICCKHQRVRICCKHIDGSCWSLLLFPTGFLFLRMLLQFKQSLKGLGKQ